MVFMTLNEFAARERTRLFDCLQQGIPPSEGEYSSQLLAEGKMKGKPHMGTTRFEADGIFHEFIYPDPQAGATVLVVKTSPPQRIVYMPVPDWVIASIWQGSVEGSYQFESDALKLVDAYKTSLSRENNPAVFGVEALVGRA